jgi:hypothetical protein
LNVLVYLGKESTLTGMSWLPLPVKPDVALLSEKRVGKKCMQSPNLAAALDCWLKAHPSVASQLQWVPGSVAWKDWPQGLKQQLHNHFWLAVSWYKQGMPPTFPQPFPILLPKNLPGDPKYFGGLCMTEQTAKGIYLSYVANALAAELMGIFPWSITSYTADDLWHLLSYLELIQYAPPSATQFPGYYLPSHISPTVPYYVVHFFKKNSLLGPTALETVSRLFGWCRCLSHYWAEPNGEIDSTCFWGPDAPPIGVSQMIEGTTYTGKVFPKPVSFGHFTGGCSGTAGFLKSVLRAVNIRAEDRFAGSHATPFFPTIDRAMSHGDDPYSQEGIVTAFPGWPVPAWQEYLITGARWNQLYGPNVPWATANANIGRRNAEIAFEYLSDSLLKAYCNDVKAQVSHANSKVFQAYLKNYYTLGELEWGQLWQRLEAKAIATGFCKQIP